MRTRHTVGIDLGQFSDYTAIAVVTTEGEEAPIHRISHLDRWRGKPYTALLPVLADLAARLGADGERPTFVLDQTGVGAAVVDVVEEAKLPALIEPVSIHGGDRVNVAAGVWRVPKRDLVAAVGVTLQSGRLRIAPTLPLVPVLTEELSRFKVKINPETAHDSYAAWREADHDDLVLATALALWFAERPGPPSVAPTGLVRRSPWDPMTRLGGPLPGQRSVRGWP